MTIISSTSSIAPQRLEQIRAFLDHTSFKDADLYPLAGDASFRRYIRVMKTGQTAMLMDAPPDKEDILPFITVAEYLYKHGYSAPSIHARHIPNGLLLLEDLGDDSFTSVLKKNARLEPELYESAIDVLVQWHDGNRHFSQPENLTLPIYSEELLMREACLFTEWYLPQIVGKEKAALLHPEYIAIWEGIFSATSLSADLWVHRDYHADNLMWLPSRPGAKRVGLLDFQDGVYGDAAYDMVSLLEDARRDVPKPLADAMLARYIAASNADAERFRMAYAVLGAQRNSKIIGIFSRLAARDNKFNYLNYLPRVWRHLEGDLAHPILTPLKQWIDLHVSPEHRGAITVNRELAITA